MDGILEDWIWKMAAALKSQDKQINVIIADWLTFAHQHYPIAVQNTRHIGQEIADFLEWLEVRAPKSKCVSLEKTYLPALMLLPPFWNTLRAYAVHCNHLRFCNTLYIFLPSIFIWLKKFYHSREKKQVVFFIRILWCVFRVEIISCYFSFSISMCVESWHSLHYKATQYFKFRTWLVEESQSKFHTLQTGTLAFASS